jgi:hypothetical protein
MKDFPNKRDFYYIVGFLIISIVLIFSGRLADNTQIVDYVGFAGTIVSILLAVIAIIYSFYQSSTYENANTKLDNSAQKIENATKELSNVSEIKTTINEFAKEVGDIKSSISSLSDIVSTIDNRVNSMNKNWEETKNSIFNTINTKHKSEVDSESFLTVDYFMTLLNSGGVLPFYCLFTIDRAIELGMGVLDFERINPLYVEEILNHDTENIEENYYQNLIHTQIGFIASFMHSSFIDIQYISPSKMEVIGINQELSEAIERKMDSLKDENEDKYKAFKNLESYLKSDY